MKKKTYEKPFMEEIKIELEDLILVSTLEGEDEETMSKDFIVW